MYDILVIGGGPSGVAAAAYSLHLGLDTLLIAPELGGKVNYRFARRGLPPMETVHGSQLTKIFAAKIGPETHQAQQVRQVTALEDGFRVETDGSQTYETRSLILCMGANPRRLYIPGEEKYWGHGLSYSAVSHAPLFVGQEVAVIGNDVRAQQAALALARIAARVYFIIPRPQGLDPNLMSHLTGRPTVQILQGWEVTAVDGDEFVSGLTLQNAEAVTREVQVDGVFVELGLLPHSEMVAPLVERDDQGYIRVDHNACTSHPAIFAAGDITAVHGEQVPIALGDGIKAALSASAYLMKVNV